ncbi:kinase-like protein [Ramaria rubella]|nr:kinase-like protein [Ramaria rubella]
MIFIRENTTIPVPKVLDIWQNDKGKYTFLMERVEGKTLKEVWNIIGDDTKDHIARQLKGYIQQLRDIQPPGMRISSLNGSSCWDERLSTRPCGPFESEEDFNKYLVSKIEKFSWEPDVKIKIDDIRTMLSMREHKICFTHGDLCSKNIIVDDYGNIKAILDWEMSGWMPEYWEYLKCIYGEDESWMEFTKKAMQSYDDEMNTDNQIIEIAGCAFF